MSRIRSIHPGFFTDESLVSVSMAARLLFLGLGVEADDKGIFEWKPLTMKMRIFPADHVDVADLLADLEEVNAIRSYEIDGRKFGAIRNFRVHQRPKTPNDVHPIPDHFRTYVGLPAPVSENGAGQPTSFPPKGEKSPQMEDGGEGEGEGEGEGVEKKESKQRFAFFGRVIRLTEKDLRQWQKSYSALDLPALLQARDDWLVDQPEADRKRWFQSTSSWLSKKQQEAFTAAKASAVAGDAFEFGPC